MKLSWSTIYLSLLCVPNAWSEELNVAVAANFAGPMLEIETAFEAATGHDLRMSFGSSGSLYAQIANGAPFEIFLSADQATIDSLQDAELLVEASRFTYAVGGLVLWSARAGFIDAELSVLAENEFEYLAIANPELAPYGQAAEEVILALGLVDQVTPKLVWGENISQTYQFVSTGSAELGFVALSQVMRGGEIAQGSYWIVPRDIYPPILQDAAVLRRGSENPAASAFVEYMRSPAVAEIVRSFGYLTLATE